jgi:hypothetical protein
MIDPVTKGLAPPRPFFQRSPNAVVIVDMGLLRTYVPIGKRLTKDGADQESDSTSVHPNKRGSIYEIIS